MQDFSSALLNEVLSSKDNNHKDNYCKFMKYESLFLHDNKLPTFYRRRLPIRGYIENTFNVKYRLKDVFDPKSFYQKIVAHYEGVSFLYNLLADQPSKDLLVKIFAYRILGYKKVKLPRNTKKYWDDIENANKLLVEGTLDATHLQSEHPAFDLRPIGIDATVHSVPIAISQIFSQHTYGYYGPNRSIEAEKGDVVLDCGACWGDTAIYFANKIGETGKVYAFEFNDSNLVSLRKNLQRNPKFAKNIELIERAVWNESDQVLTFVDHGGGTSTRKAEDQPEWEKNIEKCTSITIDDFVERNTVQKVDFIKMDIEGSELNALKGAEKTIRKFRPKLAICAYHKPDDFEVLSHYINGLGLDYEFYLEHHTIHVWDSIIFAAPRKR